ncbi:adaptin subunit, putative [Babesia bigemina]|uniref:Adaptin subunit, putative n=1 Tax=Babesia bigemina TaxID=5866 RepID=A0A061D638_BABBI|nr:adaptin subunit, putative [Babesia bigemina]CDR94384.1 adaptin subunit, putative [Babesia bigemina]|eukprot:XP_012766570.1 adaptin subunit, putative [Babesia bigemina]
MISLPAVAMDRLGLGPPKLKPDFFVDHRKGEVGELRLLLRKMAADYKSASSLSAYTHADNNTRRREILKRLIRCMTLGVDVSRLYTEVVMVSHTADPVQKKMIYMYLSTYSKDNPDLTVLTINTLLKDIENVDPVIRCLALRNISAFGTKLSNDYAKDAILKKFHDPADAVKRSAIIGGLRVYKSQCAIAKKEHADESDCHEHRSAILQHLVSSLKSLNLDVMFDSLCVYSEMLGQGDDIKLSKHSIVYLINRIKKMTEWQQCLTLQLLHTYTPAGDELFDLLNLLDELLNYSSTAVFLATAKCFLAWTAHDDMLQLEVIRRVEMPMIALITHSCDEIAYNLLLNTLLMIVNAPRLEDDSGAGETYKPPFADHYEVFFFRYDDPSYIKHVKLNILVAIACEANYLEIVKDLNEYVSDTNHAIAAKSVKAVGIIALKFPAHLEFIMSQMSVVFSLGISYLISAALYVIRALLLVYPSGVAKLLEIVEASRDFFREPQALSYYIWILGEYGESVEHAPYTLEDLIDRPDISDIAKELLCASMKVFFKRPPEMFPGLSRLLRRVMSEIQDPDLVGHADFYYVLLSTDLAAAEKIVMAPSSHDAASVLENCIVDLGIALPSVHWLDSFNSVHAFDEDLSQGSSPSRFFPFTYGDVDTDILMTPAAAESPEDSSSCADSSYNTVEGYDLPGAVSTDENAAPTTLQDRLAPLHLVVPKTLLSEEFQKSWFACDAICQSTDEVASAHADVNFESLEDLLFDVHIATLASGKSQNTTKMYQYAQNAAGQMYYMELTLTPVDGRWKIQASVKSQRAGCDEALLQSFADTLCNCASNWVSGDDTN